MLTDVLFSTALRYATVGLCDYYLLYVQLYFLAMHSFRCPCTLKPWRMHYLPVQSGLGKRNIQYYMAFSNFNCINSLVYTANHLLV